MTIHRPAMLTSSSQIALFTAFADTHQGAMFDMDGSLFNNEPIHAKIGVQVLKEHGVDVTEAWWFIHLGKGHDRVYDILLEEGHTPDISKHDFKNTCGQRYLDFVARIPEEDRASYMRPGARELMMAFVEAGKPIGVVSGNEEEVVQANIDALGIRKYLSTVVTNTRIILAGKKGKPSGDPYLMGCVDVGIDPKESLSLEDSKTGHDSAEDAGMATVVRVIYTAANQRPDSRTPFNVSSEDNLGYVAKTLEHLLSTNMPDSIPPHIMRLLQRLDDKEKNGLSRHFDGQVVNEKGLILPKKPAVSTSGFAGKMGAVAHKPA